MNAYQRDHSFYARSHGGSASKYHAMGDDMRSRCGRVRMLNPDEPRRISDVPAILRCKVCWSHKCKGCGFPVHPSCTYCGECLCEEDGL